MAILSSNTFIGGKKPILSNIISSKSVNLNDYTTEGHHMFYNLTSITNFPSSITWTGANTSHLQVFSYDKSQVIQILIKCNSNYIFMRTSYLSGENINWNSWQKIWNAGNDGNGSGLDADTLDSLQATAFLRLYNRTVSNFNSATSVGFYCINGNTNAPTTGSLWGCIVFSTDISSGSISSNWLCQIAIQDNSTGNTLYFRKNNGSTWTAWQTILSSGNCNLENIINMTSNTNITTLPTKNGNYILTTSVIESSSNDYYLNSVYFNSSRYVYTATNINTGKVFIKTANTVWNKINITTTIEN